MKKEEEDGEDDFTSMCAYKGLTIWEEKPTLKAN